LHPSARDAHSLHQYEVVNFTSSCLAEVIRGHAEPRGNLLPFGPMRTRKKRRQKTQRIEHTPEIEPSLQTLLPIGKKERLRGDLRMGL
jgi:hypothetical protein